MQLQLMAPKAPKGLLMAKPLLHEEFIAAIADAAIERIPELITRNRLRGAKLTYGVGDPGTRGVCYFNAWKNGSNHDFVTICAGGEENPIQLAGTTIHELGHVLAGSKAGHDKDWKTACAQLGLNAVMAGGQTYEPTHFDADILSKIQMLVMPTDGVPVFQTGGLAGLLGMFTGMPTSRKFKPCPLGIGTRGGKSRGVGSGSRLRLWKCECSDEFCKANKKTNKVRAANDDMDMTCNRCSAKFKLMEDKNENAQTMDISRSVQHTRHSGRNPSRPS